MSTLQRLALSIVMSASALCLACLCTLRLFCFCRLCLWPRSPHLGRVLCLALHTNTHTHTHMLSGANFWGQLTLPIRICTCLSACSNQYIQVLPYSMLSIRPRPTYVRRVPKHSTLSLYLRLLLFICLNLTHLRPSLACLAPHVCCHVAPSFYFCFFCDYKVRIYFVGVYLKLCYKFLHSFRLFSSSSSYFCGRFAAGECGFIFRLLIDLMNTNEWPKAVRIFLKKCAFPWLRFANTNIRYN